MQSSPLFKEAKRREEVKEPYNFAASKTTQFQRRIASGEWLEVKPLQDQLNGKIIYTP